MISAASRELDRLRAVWLFMLKRRDGSSTSVRCFGYPSGTFGLYVAFVLVTVVEAAVIELLIPWMWLRICLLALAAYCLFILVGLAASRMCIRIWCPTTS